MTRTTFRYRVPHFKIKCGTRLANVVRVLTTFLSGAVKLSLDDRGRTTNTTFYSLPTMRASDFALCKPKSVISKVHV